MTCRSEAGVDLRIGRISKGKALAYRGGNHLSATTREAGVLPCRGDDAVMTATTPRPATPSYRPVLQHANLRFHCKNV